MNEMVFEKYIKSIYEWGDLCEWSEMQSQTKILKPNTFKIGIWRQSEIAVFWLKFLKNYFQIRNLIYYWLIYDGFKRDKMCT